MYYFVKGNDPYPYLFVVAVSTGVEQRLVFLVLPRVQHVIALLKEGVNQFEYWRFRCQSNHLLELEFAKASTIFLI